MSTHLHHYFHKILSLPKRGAETGEALRRSDARLGHPHRQFQSIHVAGTNGKGSVATKMAAVLQNRGYKVGLYTSPHITTFRERIQINGQMISEQAAEDIFAQVFDPNLSFFDVLTLMAFVYFARERVDFAAIEVGIGGRLDSTNIIFPILTVITSIAFDHMAMLGNTLEQIAREKGGIIKKGVPLIVGATAAPFFPEAIVVGSAPFYELENQGIARRALAELGIHSEKGLEVRPPCRFQQIDNLILDVAHNPAAFVRLIEALELHFPGRKFPFYLAFSKDKDWQKCVEIIQPHASAITFLKSNNPRLIAFPEAQDICPKEGVVAGSFYIMDFIQNNVGERERLSHL